MSPVFESGKDDFALFKLLWVCRHTEEAAGVSPYLGLPYNGRLNRVTVKMKLKNSKIVIVTNNLQIGSRFGYKFRIHFIAFPFKSIGTTL